MILNPCVCEYSVYECVHHVCVWEQKVNRLWSTAWTRGITVERSAWKRRRYFISLIINDESPYSTCTLALLMLKLSPEMQMCWNFISDSLPYIHYDIECMHAWACTHMSYRLYLRSASLLQFLYHAHAPENVFLYLYIIIPLATLMVVKIIIN